MKLKLLLFILSITFSINIHSQNINTNPYWQGEIKLKDGTLKKGLVQVPNNPAQSRVAFKLTENSKKVKFKKKNIEAVKVVSKSGKIYEFEPVAVVITIKGNASLGKSLLLVYNQNDYVKFYFSSGVYRVNKNDELYTLYRFIQGQDFPTLNYYLKKRDYDKARLLYMTSLARGLKKGANAYFKEDPELLQKINNKELRFKDIDEIIATYLNTTKNM